MRLRIILCVALLLAVGAGSPNTFAAARDCARWVKEYQQHLATRVSHAAHKAKTAVRPKQQVAVVPKHRIRPPHLTPVEMVKRFKLICGEELPDEVAAGTYIPDDNFQAEAVPDSPQMDFTNVAMTPYSDQTDSSGPQMGQNTAVQEIYPTTLTPLAGVPTNPVSPIAPTQTGTGTGGDPSSGTPTNPTPVPEPSTLVLLITGGLSAIPAIKRRSRS